MALTDTVQGGYSAFRKLVEIWKPQFFSVHQDKKKQKMNCSDELSLLNITSQPFLPLKIHNLISIWHVQSLLVIIDKTNDVKHVGKKAFRTNAHTDSCFRGINTSLKLNTHPQCKNNRIQLFMAKKQIVIFFKSCNIVICKHVVGAAVAAWNYCKIFNYLLNEMRLFRPQLQGCDLLCCHVVSQCVMCRGSSPAGRSDSVTH